MNAENIINNITTIISVCVGGGVTYLFNSSEERKKQLKERNKEIYSLIKKNTYCVKKTLRNIQCQNPNLEELCEYEEEYNFRVQKVFAECKEKYPLVKHLAMYRQESLLGMRRKKPKIFEELEYFYLDETFKIESGMDKIPNIYLLKHEKSTYGDSYLDCFALRIFSSFMSYKEFFEFKSMVILKENYENNEVEMNFLEKKFGKIFCGKKNIFYREINKCAVEIDMKLKKSRESWNILRDSCGTFEWDTDKEGNEIIKEFDKKLYKEKISTKVKNFRDDLLELTDSINELNDIFYKFFYK